MGKRAKMITNRAGLVLSGVVAVAGIANSASAAPAASAINEKGNA